MNCSRSARRLFRPIAVVLALIVPSVFGLAQEKQIRLRNEQIRTQPGPVPTLSAAAENPAGGLTLLQFTGPIQPAWRAQLESLGVELLRYVPDHAFVIRPNGLSPGQLRQLPFVHWTGPYRPEHKLHAALSFASSAGPAKRAATPVSVTIVLARAARAEEATQVRGLLSRVGQETRLRSGTILRGEIQPGRLAALSESDAVLWVEPAPKMRLFDEESSKIVGGDDGQRSTPTLTEQLGYDGRGVVVAVADSGLDTGEQTGMHPDLAGRVTAFFHYGRLDDAADEHSHGTHVAGIIAGNATVGETDEFGALYGLGVAPGASIVAQRIFDGVGNFEPPSSFSQLTRDALSAGAVIGNNSWGEDVQGRYDASAAEFDALVRDADLETPGDQPYILEFSAGNAGPGARSIGTPAVAKNVIASGASQNNRAEFFIYAEGEDAMADFSSRGPAEDGRIKPDVVAPGTWIASLRSTFADDNNAWAGISGNYLYQGGTSQSGPHVAGAAAVFVQYYRELAGATPSPALVKAALINSAVDLFDEFGTDPVPNNQEGWGRIDLMELIETERDIVFIEQTNLLSTGSSYETLVVVSDPLEPLKITLAYTDEPGLPAAVPALVNDLDLEVVGPDGTLYRGNRFAGGESIPNATQADAINNVEGVHLFNPRPGEYLVRVRARNVPEDARSDTPEVDQDFALVISGKFLPEQDAMIYFDRDSYTSPDRINVGVVHPAQSGATSMEITIRSDTESTPQPLTLFRKSPLGVFTNSIVTATGAPQNDNALQITHGDVIEARYESLSGDVVRTTTALADLAAPIISNVIVTNRFGRPIISWTTDEPARGRVEYGTTTALGAIAVDPQFTFTHALSPDELVPSATYFFRIVAEDRAGNVATNNNGGALFTFVAPSAPPVLIVNGFFEDFFFDPPPPLSYYTDILTQLGVPFDVWDRENTGELDAADLRPYRVVIWRVPEFNFTGYTTFTEGERAAITNYLEQGGGFFVASMEVLSRLGEVAGESFRADGLKVASFGEDATVAFVSGVPGNQIGDGLEFELNYEDHYFNFDISDSIIPVAGAEGILVDDETGDFVGLRYPRTGVDSPGRVVFLSFPFEAIPQTERTTLLQRILQFLAPGLDGKAVLSLDRPAYALPSQMIVEVGDADLAGTDQVTVSASTTTEPAGQSFVLSETTRLGIFRGQVPIVNATNAPQPGRLRAAAGDVITVRFVDASQSVTVERTATVDLTPPVIVDVVADPDYSTAVVFWETDEPSDSLVQYGEILPLPINRTAFDPGLTFSHEVTLAGLVPDRTYYYQVVSRDGAGNTTIDNNGGNYYTFRTLKPLTAPFTDHFETGATNWSVFSSDESELAWQLGAPNNGVETEAHSPTQAWGSSLRGTRASLSDTFLISPAIYLTNGNQITLRFWHSYDFSEKGEFDLLEGGQVLLVENEGNTAISLATYFDSNFGWEQEEIDLTPYLGRIVYLVWHHQLFSFDSLPRAGWLLDDVELAVTTIVPGTVVITNNLSQARFTLSGPTRRSGSGTLFIVTNAPPGDYLVTFDPVPHYTTPATQSQTLDPGGSIVLSGFYAFPDSNANGISDLWEEQFFGAAQPGHSSAVDSDHDGASDFAEFMAGTNPTNAASLLSVTVTRQPNALLRLEWPTLPGRSYRLYQSTNLVDWSPVTDWTRSAGSTLSHLFTPTSQPTSFRVHVRP